jgi:hypothetical protein
MREQYTDELTVETLRDIKERIKGLAERPGDATVK